MNRRNNKVLQIIQLQGIIVIYSFSSVIAKLASLQPDFSFQFWLFYALELLSLAIYALFWQQIIKKFELSIAYANRAAVLLWSLLWSHFLFHEEISLNNLMGVICVVAGIIVINLDGKKKKEEEKL